MISKQAVPELIIKQVADSSGLSENEATFALQYINHYCQDPELGPITNQAVSKHVKNIQQMMGLPSDGEINSQVVKMMMHTPRCGVPDYIKMSYGPLAARWGIKNLNYFIESYVSGLSKSDQDDLIKLAFKQWADVANLSFVQVASKSNAQLVISTGRGAAANFDGPGNTLAWAYLPPDNNYRGQLLMRFDLDEMWVKNAGDRGILFLNVATHEFGHMLALDHSNVRTALMAPYYSAGITKPQMQDDVIRIQNLYGQPLATPIPPTTPTTPTTPPTKYNIEISVTDLSQIKVNGKPLVDFSLITS